MGVDGHLRTPRRDGAACEGPCVGAFDECQTGASQGEKKGSERSFFQEGRKDDTVKQERRMGEHLRFVKSIGFDKSQEAKRDDSLECVYREWWRSRNTLR